MKKYDPANYGCLRCTKGYPSGDVYVKLVESRHRGNPPGIYGRYQPRGGQPTATAEWDWPAQSPEHVLEHYSEYYESVSCSECKNKLACLINPRVKRTYEQIQ